MSEYAIGVDLGGTEVKIIAVTREGKILRTERFGTSDDSAARWIAATVNQIEQIEGELGAASGVGVASPGLANSNGRSIRWMMGRLEPVMGLDWTVALKRKSVVPVLNDAHAALLGERWLGAARGSDNVAMLTLGTGVGGAVICDGRLIKGHLGRAGHFGHISLNPCESKDIVNTPGSLEDAIGECTRAQRGGGRYASTKAMVEAARAGDAFAKEIWLTSVRMLAAGIVSIINAVDPEIFILGGGIAGAAEYLLEPLREFLDEFEWRPTGTAVRVVLATLGDRAGALGAAHHAYDF
jgi:glucokinase